MGCANADTVAEVWGPNVYSRAEVQSGGTTTSFRDWEAGHTIRYNCAILFKRGDKKVATTVPMPPAMQVPR